jgi:hypothetical protein
MPDDEGLQVKQPERRQKHQRDDDFKEGNCEPITEGGQRRQTEHCEIGGGAERRQRNGPNLGIRAAQNFGTTRDDCAAQAFSGDVLDGEIDGVSKPDQREEGGDDVRPGDTGWRRDLIHSYYRPASRSASLIIARRPSGFHDSPFASLPLTKNVGVPETPRARPRMPS